MTTVPGSRFTHLSFLFSSGKFPAVARLWRQIFHKTVIRIFLMILHHSQDVFQIAERIGDRFFGCLILLFRQCFQDICEIHSRMDPVPCEDDGFNFPIQLPVGGVSVADNDTGESFQEFPRMVRFHNRLVVLSSIHGHMVFFNFVDCRLYSDSFLNFIRRLLPASSAKDLLQLFFQKDMGNDFLAFSFFLPVRDLDYILLGEFDNVKRFA